jgi:hypothetical protein
MAEHCSSLQDIRFGMRQMSLRGERIAQSYVRAIDALTDEMRAKRAGLAIRPTSVSSAGPRAALRAR